MQGVADAGHHRVDRHLRGHHGDEQQHRRLAPPSGCPQRRGPLPARSANHVLPGRERDAAERQPAAEDVGELDRDEDRRHRRRQQRRGDREGERDEGELGRNGVAGTDDEVHAHCDREGERAAERSRRVDRDVPRRRGQRQQHAREHEAAAEQRLGPALARVQRREAALKRRLDELLLFE